MKAAAEQTADAALVYSIVRYCSLLNGLTAPKPKTSSASTTST